MCGICGLAGWVESGTLDRMCDVMTHRGPDDRGAYTDLGGPVGLAMRRLSIIDLAGGHQPLANEDETVWIVFNGEIYNYRELREELGGKGGSPKHRFATSSDTEVIVHLYEELGEACVQKLRGMFAFALWDTRQRKLVIARDRLGIKPLYYHFDEGKLAFASEIKALLECPWVQRQVKLEALDQYLTLQYVPAPRTLFEGICKLRPGHLLVWQNGSLTTRAYWTLPQGMNGRVTDEREGAEQLLEMLREAVKLRLISDVPLGAFLSGGLDSSLVVALMSEFMDQPVKTFSVGFEGWEEGSELPQARRVAEHFGCDHHEVVLQPNVEELIHKAVWHWDEPVADPAALPTYLISEFARNWVTVVLTGEGADELFAGYKQYMVDRFAPSFQRCPAWLRDGVLRPLARRWIGPGRLDTAWDALSCADPIQRHGRWVSVFPDPLRLSLYTDDVRQSLSEANGANQVLQQMFAEARDGTWLERRLHVDTRGWLPDDLLMKVDKMSMAVSLEARVPYLDHHVVEFVSRHLPGRLKLRGNTTKYILKQAARQLLPAAILNRPKHGFNLPLERWFREELRGFVQEVLLSEEARQRGYFRPEAVAGLFQEHQAGRYNHSRRLYALLMFELWHQKFIA